MKKILVACDFSKESREAFTVAIDFAAMVGADLVLFHVLDTPALYATGPLGAALTPNAAYYAQLEEVISNELENMKARAISKGVAIATRVEPGALVPKVRALIDETGADLVVMGTAGASATDGIVIGSNTEKLVRFSPVPVLTVNQAIDLDQIKDILVPSTLELDQPEFVRQLKALQKLFDATLHILLVNTPGRFMDDADADKALENFVNHYELTNFKCYCRSYRNEDDGIITFARENNMDLIAMATHARKGLAHLFNSSVTENVVKYIEIPIWTSHLKV